VRLIKPISPWYNFSHFRICTIPLLATRPAGGARGRRTMPLKIVSAVLTAAILVGMPQVARALDPKWPPGPLQVRRHRARPQGRPDRVRPQHQRSSQGQ
jgi:hypothetical protein